MRSLPIGLYELLLTHQLQQDLEHEERVGSPALSDLRNAEAADRVALHIAQVIEKVIDAAPEAQRSKVGVALARRLIERLASEPGSEWLAGLQVLEPGKVLRAVQRILPDGTPDALAQPLIPLLDTTLLTNAPGEPRIGHQLLTEIASADRIDLVMAFIRQTGINPLKERLRRHVAAGKPLRVLTTVFTGTTEAAALDALVDLGAEVRVSYDTTSTRLHAKAWLFHRESGYSTAYVGSSNLTQTAQVTGLEWNVRVSAARNRPVIDKIAAVFSSYWEQPDFEPYDRERFQATRQSGAIAPAIYLSPVEVQLYPFQEQLLERIELSRQQGFHRNLLVSATGTGKTVMAAVDYARLRDKLPRARLLFVAHREEILIQSRLTFAHVLRDGNFGEFWVGGDKPRDFEHVFASIQSLNASGIAQIAPGHFDVVIVDEFHHAAASSYERLLAHVKPVELLGLTATPERADGVSVLHWFGDRIAAELRLWDAIDQHRLVPFSYFGIADNLDLREIPWRRGSGYDTESLTQVITANDVWAKSVIRQFAEHLGGGESISALGFCVSVAHARYMARVFTEAGIPSAAAWGDMPDDDRTRVLGDLKSGRVRVVFSVDLFNEGVDVPSVNSLLMLRPTESPLLFLQQLGRGLRKSPDKDLCTVLDFVGQHRKEFRYDRRFQALLGGSRARVAEQVVQGFPFLPAGCSMQLDRVATERVLESIRNAVPSNWRAKVQELQSLGRVSLAEFLEKSGLDLDEVYAGNRSWTDLQQGAGFEVPQAGSQEQGIRKAVGRLLHVNDNERLMTWRRWVQQEGPPKPASLSLRERRLLRMLLVQLLDRSDDTVSLTDGANILWQHPAVLAELDQLFALLATRIEHVPIPLTAFPDVPLVVHASYTRLEMLAAAGTEDRVAVRPWREGAFYDRELKADFFAFTLDKTSGQFSPTTRYRDYAISRARIHWESQSTTRADSPTGRRYQTHEATGNHILLFARQRADDRAFFFLGPGNYVSHEGELPMAITWQLHHLLPGDVFQRFAAAVA